MNKSKLITAFAAGTLSVGSLSGLTMIGDDLELFVTGTASLNFQDNVFLTSQNEVDDIYLVFTPGVLLTRAGSGAANMTFSYKHSFEFYDSEGEALDDNFANLSFRTNYDSGVVLANFNVSFVQSATNTIESISNQGDITGLSVKRDTLSADLSGRYSVSSLTAIGAGLEYESIQYDEDRYVGYDSFAIPVSLFYRIYPKLDLMGGIRFRDVDVEDSDVSYEDFFYFVGAEGELLSPKFIGSVQFGIQQRESDGLAVVIDNVVLREEIDESSFFYDLRVDYLATAKMSLYASLTRDYRTSANAGGNYTFANLSLGGRLAMSPALSLFGSIEYGETDYSLSTREEEIAAFRVGATYSPNDVLSFRASYTYQDISGNGNGASDYSVTRVAFSASVRY